MKRSFTPALLTFSALVLRSYDMSIQRWWYQCHETIYMKLARVCQPSWEMEKLVKQWRSDLATEMRNLFAAAMAPDTLPIGKKIG